MRHISSDDRGVLPILVAILAVAILAVVGVAVYNISKSSQKDTQTANASPSPASSPASTASPVATSTPVPTDQELITAAVKSYDTQSTNDTVAGISIVGVNAKGNGASAGAPSGYTFVAHKDGGTWKVVYRGQKPGKALGEQYGLPADWYSTAY